MIIALYAQRYDIHPRIMFNIHYKRFKIHSIIDFPTFSNDF